MTPPTPKRKVRHIAACKPGIDMEGCACRCHATPRKKKAAVVLTVQQARKKADAMVSRVEKGYDAHFEAIARLLLREVRRGR